MELKPFSIFHFPSPIPPDAFTSASGAGYTTSVFALVLPDLGDAAVDRPYTYLIPPHLAGVVVVGGRVVVPLGHRQVAGYVLGLEEHPDVVHEKVRPILAVKSSDPVFTTEQASLARWIAHTYLCPLSEALRPCLAEAGGLSVQRRWQCTEHQGVTVLLPDPTLHAVYDYLREHPGTASTHVRSSFGEVGLSALEALRRDGLIRTVAGSRVKAREINVIAPALPAATLLAQADALPVRANKQAILLRWAAQVLETPLPVAEVARRAEVGEAVVRACVTKGWLRQERVSVRRNPWDTVTGRKAEPPVLTATQQHAVEQITAAVRAQSTQNFLLYGVTGSGKTEVFLHAISDVLAQQQQAIVLVPEISLTAQAMALYHGRFPGQVAVLHSHLSAGERYDEWQRIAGGEAQVVLGARSAIFAPCPDLGLIVIDEEHESSYKQESSPRYHTKQVALERGRLQSAPVVLASATPSLESMRETESGLLTLLRLPERIESRPLPVVKLVDLRRMTSGARILSHPLREAIERRLTDSEQVILFLNRRGYSHSLLCQGKDCGHFEVCPHCAVPLTYHLQAHLLRCHHCDYAKRPNASCPKCGGVQIAFRGVGTERLEAEVQQLWPEARIGRMDRDTTARKGAHQAILDRFGREETDILIGTQMVAKGLDFPRVTLVGVVAADTSLGVPDFRAPERTFQLLTQVAGRAGRSEWAGEVIIQTFQPEHYAIQAAMLHDYDSFYAQEIVHRGDSTACWPPLTALVNVLVNGEDESQVRATAAALARRAREVGAAAAVLPPMATETVLPGLLDFIKRELPIEDEEEEDPFGAEELLHRDVPGGVVVNDAAPCPLERLRGRYRYHIVLRGQDRPTLLRLARQLQDLTPPRSVHVVIDVDPLSLA
ncbi:MAG: replication restart helicase PriA [Armatimonadota bacterium]